MGSAPCLDHNEPRKTPHYQGIRSDCNVPHETKWALWSFSCGVLEPLVFRLNAPKGREIAFSLCTALPSDFRMHDQLCHLW